MNRIYVIRAIKSLLYEKFDDVPLIRLSKRLYRWMACCGMLMFLLMILSMVSFLICMKLTNDPMLWYYYAEFTWGWHKQECIDIGDTIVSAIEEYHADNGKYPDELNQLIPKYMVKIPDHRVGTKKWKYNRYINEGKEHFVLLFSPNPAMNYPNCQYVSLFGRWETDE